LQALDPHQRLALLEKLLAYVLPKIQNFDDAWETYSEDLRED
jgi:uncharacterized protein YozE (UPF0346 family)